MDVNELRTDFRSVYDEVLQAGLANATDTQIAEAHPHLPDRWRNEGAQAERTRIIGIREAAFEGQEALVDQLIAEGVEQSEAVLRLNRDQKTRMEGALETLKKEDPGDLGANPAEDPVEASDTLTASSKQEAGDKLDAVAKEIRAEKGCTYSQAFDEACRKPPELHKAYLAKK